MRTRLDGAAAMSPGAWYLDHFLGIGTTGMLAQATLQLASGARTSTLVARHASSFVDRHRESLARATPLEIDWRATSGFVAALAADTPADFCLLWIHGDGFAVLRDLFRHLDQRPCRLVHVLGSARGNPAAAIEELRALVAVSKHVSVRYVVLGRVPGGGRWLTHEEISLGVLRSVRNDEDVVVGEVPPLTG